MLNIGERLREERVRLGFNQADFAAIAGVAKTSQFNYEKGERSPDAAYLAAVAQRGVDVLYVITGVRKPQLADCIDKNETEFLKIFKCVAPSDQDILIRTAHALAKLSSID